MINATGRQATSEAFPHHDPDRANGTHPTQQIYRDTANAKHDKHVRHHTAKPIEGDRTTSSDPIDQLMRSIRSRHQTPTTN